MYSEGFQVASFIPVAIWIMVWAFMMATALAFLLPALGVIMHQRNDSSAVQASHTGEPTRLGWAAIFVALFGGIVLSAHLGPDSFAMLLMLSALPVLFVGLLEDLGHHVSPYWRYGGAVISSMLAVVLLGVWSPRADILLLDAAMAWAPLGIVATILITASFCHALNLIDGMNGLAAISVTLSAIGLGWTAAAAGLEEIGALAFLLGAAAFGFFLVNWPFGSVFLGDAGSYGMGHVLAWLAVSVLAGAADVAVAAILLILFWPLADVLHTVCRRLILNRPILEPDRMHMHQKIRRALEITWLGRNRFELSNPLTTLIMAPLVAAPVMTGVSLAHEPVLSFAALIGFGLGFTMLHFLVHRFAARWRTALGPGCASNRAS